MKITKVTGHGLQHEGRPVMRDGCCTEHDFGMHNQRNMYDQYGHGLCACGAVSPCEDTTAARQRWHRHHKTSILAGT